MAGREREKSSRRRAKSRARIPRSRRRLRLVWVAGIVFVSVYLYYQPLSSYFDTRGEVAAQRAELQVMLSEKTRLERRLALSTTVEATRREARRIGYVRPGEQLFIVKGIPGWHRARRSLGGDG